MNKEFPKTWASVFLNPNSKKEQLIAYFEFETEAALAWNEIMLEFYGWKVNNKLNKISKQDIQELWEK